MSSSYILYLEARYIFIFVLKLSIEKKHLLFIGTLFQILVRNIFGKGLRYLFLINSNLKLCVLLGSTNGANIPLNDEGSFSFTYLYIQIVKPTSTEERIDIVHINS